jgi:hypothetical protein
MTQKFLLSVFVGALVVVGAQAASAADWVPAGAAAAARDAAPTKVVSTVDTAAPTQQVAWAPAGAAASAAGTEKPVAVASNR